MVGLIDFKQDVIKKYREGQEQVKILVKIEKQGIISDRFKRYCTQILILEGLSKEGEFFALIKDEDAMRSSLLKMRKILTGIQYNYANDMIKKPRLKEFYQELYNLAWERYKDTLKGLSKIIEVGII